jgi:cytochrome oxidase Cu insertion factor (SCO1/SenC/PrrC family)
MRARWILGAVLLAGTLGISVGVAVAQFRRAPSSTEPIVGAPDVSWAAAARVAPSFSLHDQVGRPVSLASLQGRTVIVTFIDPLCRNYCPLVANVLNRVVAGLPAAKRPVIVAVSVNRWGNSRSDLAADNQRWRLGPQWRWAIGSSSALASVWHKYGIEVLATTKTLAGTTVHDISHTEAAYVIDPTGYQRALFMWPFSAAEVERTIRSVEHSS